ncbi:hypothetical protein CC78DRAFT_543312 [Lojkania enalia]|uniref:Uncharacterized protein n=1 Tax=Lojkania enalia TaxID=147567 RepID=A0A9P4N8L2_9PLEO|nr:hypothetical protein CC78DRAFT_543312 [Didymosphaeria enalia]
MSTASLRILASMVVLPALTVAAVATWRFYNIPRPPKSKSKLKLKIGSTRTLKVAPFEWPFPARMIKRSNYPPILERQYRLEICAPDRLTTWNGPDVPAFTI